MKKSIRDYDISNKKVIIRVDFNVPIKNGKILDDSRIVSSLDTIRYAIDNNAKVILMSHLGRIKSEEDKKKNSLYIVSKRLQELLEKKVMFINSTRGKELENAIDLLRPGDVLLMENTRFEDLYGEKESKNNSELGSYWASLGEIFINDAFGTAHRSHASNVGIGSHLPNGVGFLIEKELKSFELLNNPTRPFTVILGGSKVNDKIGVIESLVKKCDYILIGGAMAYTFLKAQGYNVGASLIDINSIDFCKDILKKYTNKIKLPVDSIVSTEVGKSSENRLISEFEIDDVGLDIGKDTVTYFKDVLDISNTVVWNGPLGYYELDEYSNGTKEILKSLLHTNKTVIIGGGDTSSCAINYGYKNKFTHISTGGGASLKLLEGKKLPGIEVIEDK